MSRARTTHKALQGIMDRKVGYCYQVMHGHYRGRSDEGARRLAALKSPSCRRLSTVRRSLDGKEPVAKVAESGNNIAELR